VDWHWESEALTAQSAVAIAVGTHAGSVGFTVQATVGVAVSGQAGSAGFVEQSTVGVSVGVSVSVSVGVFVGVSEGGSVGAAVADGAPEGVAVPVDGSGDGATPTDCSGATFIATVAGGTAVGIGTLSNATTVATTFISRADANTAGPAVGIGIAVRVGLSAGALEGAGV
jgi:hypothetical protein